LPRFPPGPAHTTMVTMLYVPQRVLRDAIAALTDADACRVHCVRPCSSRWGRHSSCTKLASPCCAAFTAPRTCAPSPSRVGTSVWPLTQVTQPHRTQTRARPRGSLRMAPHPTPPHSGVRTHTNAQGAHTRTASGCRPGLASWQCAHTGAGGPPVAGLLLLRTPGRERESVAPLRASLDVFRRGHGDKDHADIAQALASLASAYQARARACGARACCPTRGACST
jgi:hypothetical protein